MLYWGCKSTREEMQMAQVKITWKAFGDKPEIGRFISSVEFETEFKIAEADVDQFLEVVYRTTNTYSGNLWQIIEPLLSRLGLTHLSQSVTKSKLTVRFTSALISDSRRLRMLKSNITEMQYSVSLRKIR
jgi:hypothetical protein